MYCKRCRYNLKLNESRACPECGRAFDAGDPRTYRKGVGLPKFIRPLIPWLAVLFVVVLIALGVNEVRYQQELAAVEPFEQVRAHVGWSHAHPWARRIPFLYRRLQHVDSLSLGGDDRALVRDVSDTTTKLAWHGLSDGQLAKLLSEIGNLTNLERLNLRYNQLTMLPPEISMLTKLEWLGLDANPITDVDLERLNSLVNLKYLDLDGTKVTRQGIAKLQLALPNCVIWSDFITTARAEKLAHLVSMEGIDRDEHRGSATEPRSAKSMAELKELLGEAAASKFNNRIDFATHDFVLFQWAGAGRSRFTADVRDETLIFKFRPGRTYDFRHYRLAFAVRKGVVWEVE